MSRENKNEDDIADDETRAERRHDVMSALGRIFKLVWMLAPLILGLFLVLSVMDGARYKGSADEFRREIKICRDARRANESAVLSEQKRGFREPEEDCPNYMLLQRDAQLDAAYDAGWSQCINRYEEQDLEGHLRDCTERLMRCRNPVMPVLPVQRSTP